MIFLRKRIFSLTLFLISIGIGFFIAFSGSANEFYKIKKLYGNDCEKKESCDKMMYVDCRSEVDGPAYYLDENFEIIGTSGGLCMLNCSGAPEKWKQCITNKNQHYDN